MLKDLKCLLAIRPPQAAVVEQLLLRIGVQVTLNAEPRDTRIPAGTDVVICDQELLHGANGRAQGTSGQSTLLLLAPLYAPNAATFNATQEGAAATELPQPVLRSNLEPLLLRVALQRKLQNGAPGMSPWNEPLRNEPLRNA